MTTVISESRAATDTRDRVRAPNSRPRTVVVVGLGQGGRACVASLDIARMPHVRAVAVPTNAKVSTDRVLECIAENAEDFGAAIEKADMVFAVCKPGDDVSQAASVARLAHHRNLLLTGVVIGAPGSDANLDALRNACDIFVVSSDQESLEGMLAALGST